MFRRRERRRVLFLRLRLATLTLLVLYLILVITRVRFLRLRRGATRMFLRRREPVRFLRLLRTFKRRPLLSRGRPLREFRFRLRLAIEVLLFLKNPVMPEYDPTDRVLFFRFLRLFGFAPINARWGFLPRLRRFGALLRLPLLLIIFSTRDATRSDIFPTSASVTRF